MTEPAGGAGGCVTPPIRVLVTGGRGQLGREFHRLSQEIGPGDVVCDAPGHDALDVTDPASVEQRLGAFGPDVVVHAAALTDVDRCESDPQEAERVNAAATAHVARWCASRGRALVYVSTDYVFDGRKNAPYTEDDATNPLSVYGRTKLQGERAVREAAGPHVVVRTSWVYSALGRNFALAILEAGRRAAPSGSPLRVVADQIGSPTHARDLAKALMAMIRAGLAGSRRVYHAANAGACSRFEQAVALLEEAGLDVPVEAVSTASMPRPARRPAYSALDCTALAAEGIMLRPWRQAISAFVAHLWERRPDLQPGGKLPT